MNRRSFLGGAAAVSAAAVGAQLVTPPSAQAGFSFNYEIDDDFASADRALIDEALDIVVDRLTKSYIQSNMYSFSRYWGYRFRTFAWEASNLEEHDDDYWSDKQHFLEWQLDNLDNIKQRIVINEFYERSNTYGQASVGIVSREYLGDGKGRWSGHFELDLNSFHLNAPANDHDSSPNFWAAVIAHEMLHNLGHTHGDRTEFHQMIAFEHCFFHDGEFVLGRSCPKYGCGARIT